MDDRPLIDPSRPVRTRSGLEVQLDHDYIAAPGDPRRLRGRLSLQNDRSVILTWTWYGEWNHEGGEPSPWDLVNLTDEEMAA